MYGTTWRMLIATLFFYGFRAIVQVINVFQFPEGYVWEYPGFFSIFVPYSKIPDFFYSGHVGVCILHYHEFQSFGWYWWSYYALLTMCAQIFLMYCSRGHYTIDMIAGVIIAHYFFILVEKHVWYFDYYVFGIPLQKRIANGDQLQEEKTRRAKEMMELDDLKK